VIRLAHLGVVVKPAGGEKHRAGSELQGLAVLQHLDPHSAAVFHQDPPAGGLQPEGDPVPEGHPHQLGHHGVAQPHQLLPCQPLGGPAEDADGLEEVLGRGEGLGQVVRLARMEGHGQLGRHPDALAQLPELAPVEEGVLNAPADLAARLVRVIVGILHGGHKLDPFTLQKADHLGAVLQVGHLPLPGAGRAHIADDRLHVG